MRLPSLALAGLIVAAALAGCASPATTNASSPSVMASFYPLQYLTQRIAGPAGQLVGVIVPPGAEPHDYDLKPSDQAKVANAKLIVLQGAGLEAFHDKLGGGDRIVVATAGIALRSSTDPSEPGSDPHTWVSPVTAMAEARTIEAALERADPANKTGYQDGLASLLSDLRSVDAAYRGALVGQCAKPKIITTHAAFGYLASEYGFTQFAISGLSPDAEPSAAKIRETADLARRENITTIFFETLVSPSVAQTIATEVHGKTDVLDPIEGVTPRGQAAGENYVTLMLKNLDHLRAAMECSP
ncbi:MAG: zinc ABC transporter substrate-binding protein [Candidatus Thermoplasmatota archaeon]